MKRWFDCLVRLLFPRSCVVCDGPLTADERFVCVNCLIEMPRTNFHLVKDNKAEKLFWGQVPIERATAFMQYAKGSDFSNILFQLKYYGNREIGELFGRSIAMEIKDSGFFTNIDLIIPVPLHEKKKKERGYNQSESLAKGVSLITGIPINTATLCRKIENPTQTRKSVFERWENVRDIFEIDYSIDLNGKHILLIDDVLTTGATLLSCSRTLTQAYCVKISILTLAMA